MGCGQLQIHDTTSNPSSIKIGDATREDNQCIYRVLELAFHEMTDRNYSKIAINAAIKDTAEIEHRILSDHIVLVAKVAERIVGTVSGCVEHMAMHMKSLAVIPSYRNKGIASQLIRELESRAITCGCNKVFVQTALVMFEAIRLYIKLGYRVEGHLNNHYYGEDLLFFGKSFKEDDENWNLEFHIGAIRHFIL